MFIKLDHYFLRQIVGCHLKAPIEFLYLETSSLPIEYILASRRLNYLHNVLTKDADELVQRVYFAQKVNPNKGDWCIIIQNDMEMVNMNLSECEISSMSKTHFKNHVKTCVSDAAFKSLRLIQSEHDKVKHIDYRSFKPQSYLTSAIFNCEESSTLFNMRSNTVNGFKMCFSSIYKNDTKCKLGCPAEYSLDHCFRCFEIDKILSKTKIPFGAIFEEEVQQKLAVTEFIQRTKVRASLLAVMASQGQILDTSTSAGAGRAGT